MQTVYHIAGSLAAIGTSIAAIIAVCVYRRNWRLEQSRWASSFYERFYESDDKNGFEQLKGYLQNRNNP